MRVREILDSETCLETRRGSYIRQYNPYPIRVSGPMSTGFELEQGSTRFGKLWDKFHFR